MEEQHIFHSILYDINHYFSNRKLLLWLNRIIKPLLEFYYAPFKIHTCYCPGLLLSVHCIFHVVFSLNSLGAITKSLLAINVTFTALVILAWLSVIYKNFFANIISPGYSATLQVYSLFATEKPHPSRLQALNYNSWHTYYSHIHHTKEAVITRQLLCHAHNILSNFGFTLLVG